MQGSPRAAGSFPRAGAYMAGAPPVFPAVALPRLLARLRRLAGADRPRGGRAAGRGPGGGLRPDALARTRTQQRSAAVLPAAAAAVTGDAAAQLPDLPGAGTAEHPACRGAAGRVLPAVRLSAGSRHGARRPGAGPGRRPGRRGRVDAAAAHLPAPGQRDCPHRGGAGLFGPVEHGGAPAGAAVGRGEAAPVPPAGPHGLPRPLCRCGAVYAARSRDGGAGRPPPCKFPLLKTPACFLLNHSVNCIAG